MPSLSIVCTDCHKLERAQQCAEHLGLTISSAELDYPPSAYVLIFAPEKVSLRCAGPKAHGDIVVDFVGGELAHRRRFGGGKGQMIAKALGIKGGINPKVLDATAGLGKDSFVCASLGCEVWLCERSPVAFALLQDGLMRGLAESNTQDPELSAILERMHLTFGDSRDVAHKTLVDSQADVVYLDPMFPLKNNSALANKGMRAFQILIGADDDEAQVLTWALELAKYRVVVKRPRKAPAICGPKPSYALEGKSSRYDVYALKTMS